MSAGQIYHVLQDQSDLLADQELRIFALNLHQSFKSLREVAREVCGEQELDDLKRRITIIPKVLNSLFTLRQGISQHVSSNSSYLARDLLLLEPDISELLSRSFQFTGDLLNGLSPVFGPPSSHLTSLLNLMTSAQEHRDAIASMKLNLEILSRSNSSFTQLQEEMQQLLLGMNQLPEQAFPSELVNSIVNNLSVACKLRQHVDSAEKNFLIWQQSPQRSISPAESLSKVDLDLKETGHLLTTITGTIQLMDARSIILSHLESFSLIFERVESFEQKLSDFGDVLSAVAPTKSLNKIDEETATLFRDVRAFYSESSALICDESQSGPPSTTMLQSTSLERASASLLQRLGTLEQSFSEGNMFSQAYSEKLDPFLQMILLEASALSVVANEAHAVALILKPDSAHSLPSALATAFCQNATAISSAPLDFEKKNARCASGQKDPVFVKKMMMQALHFVASEVYTVLQYRRAVVDAVGNELSLASQGSRTLTFTDFVSSLKQLPVESLRSIWQGICTAADHLTRNNTCVCIYDLMSYSFCTDSATLRGFIASAYIEDVAINEAGVEGTSLIIALDIFFLLARSNHEPEVETEIFQTGFSELCQIAQNGTYHSKSLQTARDTVQTICWMQIIKTGRKNASLYSSDHTFSSLAKQATTLWEDLRVVMQKSSIRTILEDMASIHFRGADIVELHIHGSEALAMALRDIQHNALVAHLHNLTVAESRIKAIMSQSFKPFYCDQYPTIDELSAFAAAADAAWVSMNANKSLLHKDMEMLGSRGLNPEKQTKLNEYLPPSCSLTLCIQMEARSPPDQRNTFHNRYKEFAELISHAYFDEKGTMLPKITAPGLYSQYSIRASSFFGSERLLVTLQPHGLKKLQGRASLIVVVRMKGGGVASVEKIFELSQGANEFTPFHGSVDGVTVANELVWVCSENQGKLHSFNVSDIMAGLGGPAGPSQLNTQNAIDIELAGIRPASVFFETTTQRLWVGEYALPKSSDAQTPIPGLACGFQADANGLINLQAKTRLCIVVGEFVQGIALFRTTGKKMIALSRCIDQHLGSPCKVEFHQLDCVAQSSHQDQECRPYSSTAGTPTWDLTGAGNALGNSLHLAIRVPPGAQGLSFKSEGDIFGGYLLVCFASATEEAIDVYALGGHVEDSIYVFATPFTADGLHVSRNEIYLTVMGQSIVSQQIFSLPSSGRAEMCSTRDVEIWSTTASVLEVEARVCLHVAPICVVLSMGFSLGAGLDLQFKMCLPEFSISAALIPSVRLEVDIKAFVELVLIRAGIGATATILHTRFIPEFRFSFLSLIPWMKQPPAIEFTSKLEIIPIAVKIYVFVDVWSVKLKWGFIPYDMGWTTFVKHPLVTWSMDAIIVEGPGRRISFRDLTPPKPGTVLALQTSISSTNIEWLGFSEEDSEILTYFVCIGSGADKFEFMPCVDVGLATSFQGRDLQIPHTSLVVVTIRSVILFLFFGALRACVSDR